MSIKYEVYGQTERIWESYLAISIHFFTVIAVKRVVAESLKGGVQLFQRSYPCGADDGKLVAAKFMSETDAWACFKFLQAGGLDVGRSAVIVDMMVGPVTDHIPEIKIHRDFNVEAGSCLELTAHWDGDFG